MTENIYTALEGKKFNLDKLSVKDRNIFQGVQEFATKEPKPSCCEVANFWTDLVVKAYTESPEITEMAIYKICQDIEGRRGIEQGYIQPPEGHDWLGELGWADRGKVLFVFYALARYSSWTKTAMIPENRIDSYLFLLDKEEILPLVYLFGNRPEPYSDFLHDELDGLVGAGFLARGAPLIDLLDGEKGEYYWVKADGILWILDHIPEEPLYKQLRSKIAEKIKEYASWSDQQILEAALSPSQLATLKN